MTTVFVPRVVFQYVPPPFAGEIEGMEQEMYQMPVTEEEADEYDLEISNFYEDDEGWDLAGRFPQVEQKQYAKGIMTQAGIFPLNENYNPFDFWLLHTNFIISEPTFNAIDNAEGVEALFPITKYRVKFSIGKAFNQAKIMANVKSMLENEALILDKITSKIDTFFV
jgi:hypothetical protein